MTRQKRTAVGREPSDPVLEALDELIAALAEGSPRDQIVARGQRVRELRAEGQRYSDIVGEQFRPLVVEMIADYIRDLTEASGRFRRAQAKALHEEGMTMEAIAESFGVTRQRISQLLKDVPSRR